MSTMQRKKTLRSAQAPVDPLRGMLCNELRRTTITVVSAMTRAFADLGLKPSDASLLAFIGANPDCTQSDIARAFGNKATNLVSLIANLEDDGLLVRAPGGGRAIALTLSKKGRTVFLQVQARFKRLEDGISRNLSKALHAEIVAALLRIAHDACHYDDE